MRRLKNNKPAENTDVRVGVQVIVPIVVVQGLFYTIRLFIHTLTQSLEACMRTVNLRTKVGPLIHSLLYSIVQ